MNENDDLERIEKSYRDSLRGPLDREKKLRRYSSDFEGVGASSGGGMGWLLWFFVIVFFIGSCDPM